MKRYIIVFLLLSLAFVSLYIILNTGKINRRLQYNNKSIEQNSSNSDTGTSKSNIPDIQNESKIYKFDYDYIDPKFSLKYPAWKENICKDSGCYLINLDKNNQEIKIGLSGQRNATFEQSLNDWITNFGSDNVEYDYEIIEVGIIPTNREYRIYNIKTSKTDSFLLALVNVTNMYEGKGYLAIKGSSLNLLSEVKEIINSIK